jgi:DNA-binding MltR family transcriptional regulator
MARELSEAIDILKEHGIDFELLVRDTNAETMLQLGSLLDEFLKTSLQTRSLKDGKEVNEKAFQKGGKLENLASKIKKAKNLELLDEAAWKDAETLREIRNEFGHLKTKVHFDSPEILKWVKQLSTYDETKPNQTAILAAMTKVTDQLRAAAKRD